MDTVSIPVGGSLSMTYMHNQPNLRFSGVNPLATAFQISELVQGILNLQTTTLSDAFLISEFELQKN